jgi:DNA-binding CsgD family transcriptional regulator
MPMINRSELDLSEYLDRLYGGVLNASNDWAPVLESLCRLVGGTHGQFFAGHVSDPAGPAIRTFHGPGASAVDEFLSTVGRDDPRLPRLMQSRGRVVRDSDIEPPDFESHPIVSRYLDPIRIRRMMGVSWSPDGEHLAIIGVFRSRENGAFGDNLVAPFEMLTSHLLRAYDLQRNIVEAQTLKQSVSDFLFQSPRSVILVDARGHVVAANQKVEQIAGGGRFAARLGGKLFFADPHAMRSIDAARGAGTQSGGGAARLFVVSDTRPNSDRLRRLVGRVVPLPPAHPFRLAVAPEATAAVYLAEVSASPIGEGPFHAGVLSSLFGLSRHEARLAVHVGSGQSVDAASKIFGVSRNTARVQLQSVFAKTETCRQSELVLLVQRLASLFH